MSSPATQSTDGTSVDGIKQLGLVAALASLSYVFWVVGAMEMIERLAYYGVKAVATLYAKDPVSAGGLGVTLTDFGTILSVWALVQATVPVFTGGLSDRYGYKRTIALSTVVKICGYLIMAFFPTFYGFFAGAIVLATGTAIFKPGIQGTLVRATTPDNSSMAWGIFYQTVNIGGFLGPLVAGFLRKMAWHNVFFACAAIISINFLLLLVYKEPAPLEPGQKSEAKSSLVWDSIHEITRLHVWTYLLIFSGFWFMFNALFDVLPAHIDDWVDTTDIVHTLFGTGGATNPVVKFFVVMNEEGTRIQPEGMLNLNAGLIMTTCFLLAWVSGKMKATTSMVVGTLFASVAMFLSGWSVLGWVSVGAILVFSVGEMLSSPKFSEFIGNLAPPDKKAMYLGFSQAPIAVGWFLEGKIAPTLYDQWASKERFARELLVERGMTQDVVDKIPQGEAFGKLVEFTGQSEKVLTDLLYSTHDVGRLWILMGVLGVLSAAGIFIYGRYILTRPSR